MRFCFLLFFLPVFAKTLLVPLKTASDTKAVYFGELHSEKTLQKQAIDAKKHLEKNLASSGFLQVLSGIPSLEKALPESGKNKANLSPFQRENIPFCLTFYVKSNLLQVRAFDIENQRSKTYPSVPLERQALNFLSDALLKDLCGREGIFSKKILFTKREKAKGKGDLKFLSEIWIAESDGSNAKKLTSENSYCLCPTFFPKLKGVFLYASEKNGQSKIYRKSFLDNTPAKALLPLRGNQVLLALSRDGRKIAFISDAAGRPDLFLQYLDPFGNPIGKPLQLFSAPRATQASPSFSPDGEKIAFVSDKSGTPRIYLLDVKRPEDPELITKVHRENTSPCWSPDGTKIAYSAKVEGVRQIWVYDLLEKEELALTTGGENKENPYWGADSFHLLYNTESSETCEIFSIDLEKKTPRKILLGAGQKRFASWQY